MNTIREYELASVIRSGGLTRMSFIQNEEGKFRVVVNLNNQEGDFDVVTFRKKPREWASLNRLVMHIQAKYIHIPAITLNLFSGETDK